VVTFLGSPLYQDLRIHKKQYNTILHMRRIPYTIITHYETTMELSKMGTFPIYVIIFRKIYKWIIKRFTMMHLSIYRMFHDFVIISGGYS
jgi:hypothetical protein